MNKAFLKPTYPIFKHFYTNHLIENNHPFYSTTPPCIVYLVIITMYPGFVIITFFLVVIIYRLFCCVDIIVALQCLVAEGSYLVIISLVTDGSYQVSLQCLVAVLQMALTW